MHSATRARPLSVSTTLRALKHSIRSGPQSRNSSQVFTKIHDRNTWGSPESVSGPGSDARQTEEIRAFLPGLLSRYRIGMILDIPCGDFAWMSRIDIGQCKYIGADVVESLIEKNKVEFGKDRIFLVKDLTKDDLPKADLVMCRDCLIHLSFRDGIAALKSIQRSGARYLLATTDPNVTANRPIKTGEFSPRNLMLPPYDLPAPLETQRDRYKPNAGEPLIDPTKHIALFDISDWS
jgi:hypothetical protein